eukprot:TRINITY_DN8485_c0_g1_i1.p4 TRINITY_DN8485_c0_g1~~TRINITY_DN8485_c0_g1_i1.p4  ORF type:complete len:100 (+),score=33.55 TRINITY_DN8485_c0_g1_i1:240-539(+)
MKLVTPLKAQTGGSTKSKPTTANAPARCVAFSGTKDSSQFSGNSHSRKHFKHGLQPVFLSVNEEQVPIEQELALQKITPKAATSAAKMTLEVKLKLPFG